MNKIKLIAFDVDGVLLNSFKANLKFFQDLMIKAGYKPPTEDEYQKLFHLTMENAIKELTQSNSEEEIQRIWQMGSTRQVPYSIELLSSPEGLKEVIETLARDYTLGIVTSRIKNTVFESPILKSVEHFFEEVVTFEDTHKHKPHPDPLLLLCNVLCVGPESTVYIGDTQTDIDAAASAGIRSILYPMNDTVIGATATTNIFKNLPHIIKSLNQE